MKENDLYLFNQDDVQVVKTELNTDNKPIIEFATANSLHQSSPEQVRFAFNNEEIYEKLNALD